MRQIVMYPGEDGWWVVECPRLPSCISQGRTKEEAAANIREAIELYTDVLNDRNQMVLEDSLGGVVTKSYRSGCHAHMGVGRPSLQQI